MARPYIFEDNFEYNGAFTLGGWDSETDTGSLLNQRHYTFLARENVQVVGGIAPFRGAYCPEWNLGDTNDHTLIEGDIDIADTVTRYSRFYFFPGLDLRATADDTWNIYEVQGTANAIENAVGLRITAASGLLEIGVGNTAPTAFYPIQRGRWYCVELISNIQSGGTGTATLQIDGTQVAQVTTLTNTAVLRGVLGSQDTLATTTGHFYIDQFAFDDARIGPFKDRYPETILIYKSQHLALGQTDLLNVTLEQGAGTDNVLKIYDTDIADTTDEHSLVAWLYNLTASEPPIDLADVPVTVKRGVYVELSGTSPRALIHIGSSQGYYSAGRIRQHGSKL